MIVSRPGKGHAFGSRVPISWWIYALAGGGALLIALVTVSWQAIRAAPALTQG